MRRTMLATALALGLTIAAPTLTLIGSSPAAAQGRGGGSFRGGGGFQGGEGSRGGGGGFHGGEGFRGGGGFHGGGGSRGGGGGFRGGEGFRGGGFGERHEGWGGERAFYGGRRDYDGYGGYRGGFYNGYGGGYGWGGYGGGYGWGGYGWGGYGCCGYYGGYYDGAGLLLGAAAVAGVTALAFDGAYDRPYARHDYGYAPPRYGDIAVGYRGTTYDRRSAIDQCARAAESEARGFSSYARFEHVEAVDRNGDYARVRGTVSVAYDADAYGRGTRELGFTCEIERGRVAALRIARE